MMDMMNREKMLEVFDGVDPRKIHDLATMAGCRLWAAESIDGPVVVRHTGINEVTFFIRGRVNISILKSLRIQSSSATPIGMVLWFRIGWRAYWWNRIAVWVRGE